MPLRLIEIVLPQGYKNVAEELIKNQDPLDFWEEEISKGQTRIKILLPTDKTEAMMDILEKRFSMIEGFRMMLLAVEASVPRPKMERKRQPDFIEISEDKKQEKKGTKIAREELYSDISQNTRLSWVFIVMIILASLVASIGILRDNVIFIIGAMVIAPVLGPNVALSFGTTLGDIDLTRGAIKTIAIGILAVVVFSAFVGVIFAIDPEIPEISSRTVVSIGDIILALAAGSAAVLSLTSGLLSALIGVMVAVALLPPLVTFGMLVGSGHWDMALGSLQLFLINLICVNLAGVVTFLVQGIRPLTWWETDRAKKATRIALILWISLLIILMLFIFFSKSG